jgi:hypothetical protein
MALAALIATVVLQSRELRATREELKKQAEAQGAYARAAQEQIAVQKIANAITLVQLHAAHFGIPETVTKLKERLVADVLKTEGILK